MTRPGFGLSSVLAATAFAVVAVLLALPNLFAIHSRADQDWVPRALLAIAEAQTTFREEDKDGDKVLAYGDLAALASCSLVEPVLGSGTKHGYTFEVRAGKDPRFVWWAVARPVVVDAQHSAVFFACQRNEVYRIAADHPAAKQKPDPERGEPPIGVITIATGAGRCR